MNTTSPDKLKRVVGLLGQKKQEIDAFYQAYVFIPYQVDILNCLIMKDLEAAKRLLDFSFTTRQGGQNKTTLEIYEKRAEDNLQKLKAAMAVLMDEGRTCEERYATALALINSIEGIGQKIATMFIKFLVYYSADFPGKKELERELFVPFDGHVCNLLFTEFNGKRPHRLNLYDENVHQAALSYEIGTTEPLALANTKLIKLQRKIRDDFDQLDIQEPPIILDYLFYVGMMYCSNRLGSIGCKTCFLKETCATGRP
jgi:hypothetical protein